MTNDMENKVLITVTKAKTGEVSTTVCRNLRTDIGVNWQALRSIGDADIEAARNIALSSRATAPTSGDTDLMGEQAADGLSRKTGTYSHTPDQSLATLSESWQYTGGSTVTIKKAAIATAATDLGTSADTHFLITAVSPVAVLDSSDTIAVDWGVNF
jgi:hypothetical protein